MLRRVLVSLLVGLAAGLLASVFLSPARVLADFTWPYRAAQYLRVGADPYYQMQFVDTVEVYPYDTPFFYPLPAALVALPLTFLPRVLVAPLFFGLSSAVLAFGLLRCNEYWRLLIFLSGPFFACAALVQWPPLMIAAALVPGFGWLLACKPTLGLAAWCYRPSRWSLLLMVVPFLVSFLVLPSWPLGWLSSSREQQHGIPILVSVFSPLLWLAWLFRGSREGRLFLGMAFVPQLMFCYDQLALLLVPRTWRQLLVAVCLSWPLLGFGWGPVFFDHATGIFNPWFDDYWLVAMYFPALAFLWWQHRHELRWPAFVGRLRRPVRV